MSNELRRVLMRTAGVALALALPFRFAPAIAAEPMTLSTSGAAGSHVEIAEAETSGPRYVAADDVETQSQEQDSVAAAPDAKAFAQCLSYWDPGTHMTEDEWRESCKRLVHDRAHAHAP